jgi:hypothetical protein
MNIRSRRAWCYSCNKEVTPQNFVIGDSVERFGKALKPKPSDEFVAKPPQETGAEVVNIRTHTQTDIYKYTVIYTHIFTHIYTHTLTYINTISRKNV